VNRLQDKVAIVTGAGAGRRLGIAAALAREGAAVALLGRTEAKVADAAERPFAQSLAALA
jgi:2-hydroxycyclohexanecarboxyl-CoA dehydrogenase